MLKDHDDGCHLVLVSLRVHVSPAVREVLNEFFTIGFAISYAKGGAAHLGAMRHYEHRLLIGPR